MKFSIGIRLCSVLSALAALSLAPAAFANPPVIKIENFTFNPSTSAISQVYQPDFSTSGWPVPALQTTSGEPYDSMNQWRNTYAKQSWYPDPSQPTWDSGIDGINAGNPAAPASVQGWSFGYRMLALEQMYEATHDTAYLDLLIYMGYKIMKERDDYSGTNHDDLRGANNLPGWGQQSADWGNQRTIFKEMSGLYVYPLLKFARLVYADRSLRQRYKQTADLYYQLGTEAVTVFFKNQPASGWEYSYHVPTSQMPYLWFHEPSTIATITCAPTNEMCLNYKNYATTQSPMNMMFLLGRAILEIWKVENSYPLSPHVSAASRFDTAAGADINYVASTLVQYFQEFSTTTGSPPYRLWNYWDVAACPGGLCRLEDVSHGSLDVDFLILASKLDIPSVTLVGGSQVEYGCNAEPATEVQQLARTYSTVLDKLATSAHNLAYDLRGTALSSTDAGYVDYRYYCGFWYGLDEYGGNVDTNCAPIMTDRSWHVYDLGLANYIQRKFQLIP